MTKLGGRYTVLGKALSGGMGAVYPCTDDILERKVAVKVMQDSEEARRLVDEISALLKLRSKHVVQVYDILRLDATTIGIVQEFIEGTDLFDESTKAASPQALLKQLWQIASGIADIHEAGVIHRDIKLNNMKLDSEGIVKIFDFGLARDDGPEASTMGFVGTKWFAAPELYGTKVQFSTAVDTYAFGVCATYLIARKLPNELGQQPPVTMPEGYLNAAGGGVSPDIISMIEACLSTAPLDRPSMQQVRETLAKHLLFDRHQALVVYKGQASYLNASNREVSAKLSEMGSITIAYDGMDFVVADVQGDVFINYGKTVKGQALPGSCVVALGGPDKGASRRYVTFDLASPEVVL
ncbi:serine/threonine-protein kinase [Pseudoxanthomonas suwonensis]|uniref:Protein kinase n=1 Tax=Pseudoxanthomonas suwonensis TaxID=314722 RepID=A0A0E3Z0S9_9GAMM|nr:serine/threonine-protein kinase [Pseudoxanthomonas suwonensis]AKC86328.1 protein kinase [Pseudoxanthomonas suwonensis]